MNNPTTSVCSISRDEILGHENPTYHLYAVLAGIHICVDVIIARRTPDGKREKDEGESTTILIRTNDGGEQDESARRRWRDGRTFGQDRTGILESRGALRRVYQRIVRLGALSRRRPNSCFAGSGAMTAYPTFVIRVNSFAPSIT